MIAVPMWSNGPFVLILLSLFATVVLVVGGLLLVLFPPLRRSVGRHPKLGVGLVVASPILVLASLPTLTLTIDAISAWRSVNAPESARHVTLDHAQTVEGFDMPAGTRLDLIEAYDLSTFKHAEFPRPIRIFDVTTLGMNSVLPYSIGLTGPGEQIIDGWTCNASYDIQFSRSEGRNFDLDETSSFHFSGCTLGRGNRIADNLPMPENSKLAESVDTLDRPGTMTIKVAEPLPIGPGGALLEKNCLVINRGGRSLTNIDEGRLVRPLKWKNVIWPVGTEVMWDAPSQKRKQSPEESWVFMKSLFPDESNYSCL